MAKQLSSFQPKANPIIDGLVGYWKLDESSGNASDSSGNGYTLTNNSSVAFASGKINNGADFGTSGTTKSFSSSNTTLCRGSNSFTFNTWYKLAQQPSGTQQNIFSIRGQSSSGKRQVNFDYRDAGGLGWNLWTGSTGGTETKYNVTETIGTWVMMTVTYDSTDGNLRAYRNNTLIITHGTGGADAGSDIFKIGNEVGDNRQVFGMQDEVGFWNRVLSPLELQALYNSGNAMAYPLGSTPNSTKLYMPLNGNSVDISGNGNHGTDTAITYVQGKFGQGARFNGSSSQILFTNVPQTGAGAFTASLWVKGSTLTTNMEILAWGNASTHAGFDIYMNSSNVMTANFFGGGGIANATTKLTTQNWQYVTVTYDGTNTRMYINGVLEGTSSSYTSANVGTTNKFIGKDLGGGNWWNGLADEIILENRAWTAQEISTYYRKSMLNYRQKSLFNMLKDFILTGNTGVFNLTGANATLTEVQVLIAQTGAYLLTGYNSIISWAYTMVGQTGTFIKTGYDATIREITRIAGLTGSFILSGKNAILKVKGWTKTPKDDGQGWTKTPKD